MAHLWAFEVVVLAGFSDAPLAEALELMELSLLLRAHRLLFKQRYHGRGEDGLLPL